MDLLLKKKLIKLKNEDNLYAVKTDLESEDISLDRLKILRNISAELNLKYIIKIGGCGAIGDILKCKNIGADIIVAPMIETEYSLKKFIQCCNEVYYDKPIPKLHVNIETITGVKNFSNIVSEYVNNFSGIVFGRSDFTNSLPMDNNADSEKVFNYINDLKIKTFSLNKDFIVGGSLTKKSIPFIQKLKPTFVETRNLVFPPNIKEHTIKNYIEFEILWLNQKRNLTQIDTERIELLKTRNSC